MPYFKAKLRVSEQCFTPPPTPYRLLKEMLQKRKKTTKTTKYTYTQTIRYTQKDIHKISTTSPLVYTNMG